MIVAHHGYGEELVVYAAAGGAAVLPALVLVWKARIARVGAWLRRR